MSMSGKPSAPTYPEYESHEKVVCPQCRRNLSDRKHRSYGVATAPFMKACGILPCYGVAWYSIVPPLYKQEYY